MVKGDNIIVTRPSTQLPTVYGKDGDARESAEDLARRFGGTSVTGIPGTYGGRKMVEEEARALVCDGYRMRAFSRDRRGHGRRRRRVSLKAYRGLILTSHGVFGEASRVPMPSTVEKNGGVPGRPVSLAASVSDVWGKCVAAVLVRCACCVRCRGWRRAVRAAFVFRRGRGPSACGDDARSVIEF